MYKNSQQKSARGFYKGLAAAQVSRVLETMWRIPTILTCLDEGPVTKRWKQNYVILLLLAILAACASPTRSQLPEVGFQRGHDDASLLEVGNPEARQRPLFGINLYHTSPVFWPASSVEDVIDEVISCKNIGYTEVIRFFLPTVGAEATDWQEEWLQTTFDFIEAALSHTELKEVHVVLGYGLDYHLSQDISKLLPDEPASYIESVSAVVAEQVSRVLALNDVAKSKVCWQLENELDIAAVQKARPNRGGYPWTERGFVSSLILALLDAVKRSTGQYDPCVFVTLSPLALGSNDIYPWEASRFREALDFVGLHIYPFGEGDLAEHMLELVRQTLFESHEKYDIPIMVTEFGIQARAEPDGFVQSQAEQVRFWIKNMADITWHLHDAGVRGLLYFKWDDADNAAEEACGYQGFMGFYKFGGPWYGHAEKRFLNQDGGCSGPFTCWCEATSAPLGEKWEFGGR